MSTRSGGRIKRRVVGCRGCNSCRSWGSAVFLNGTAFHGNRRSLFIVESIPHYLFLAFMELIKPLCENQQKDGLGDDGKWREIFGMERAGSEKAGLFLRTLLNGLKGL